MQVKVLFFGSLRDAMGKSSETMTLPEGAAISDLLKSVTRDKPAVSALIPSLAISVNQEYATRDVQLRDRDEVALLPPVSGGAVTAGESCEIVRDRIDTASVVAPLKRDEDGAVVVFEGIVRNNTRGRKTSYLEYHAYEQMAIKQMDQLVSDARQKFGIDQARIVHRLGELQIGDISVLIVVTSAHRGAAFDASRFLIDNLKRTVPIWKKEFFEDGVVWTDGEPFPETFFNPAKGDRQ
ncbi:MAG TPA: molybdenum cofactor biosynthesis protein MoaE [Terriglobales bacterium]|nr:molybdenum cofactor biosynthesis protein MoaE [Terriglobales bacterium]